MKFLFNIFLFKNTPENCLGQLEKKMFWKFGRKWVKVKGANSRLVICPVLDRESDKSKQ
jgi:hypothetical protein